MSDKPVVAPQQFYTDGANFHNQHPFDNPHQIYYDTPPGGRNQMTTIVLDTDRDLAIAEIAEGIAARKKGLNLPLNLTRFATIYTLDDLVTQCGKTAKEHGFWDAQANAARRLIGNIKGIDKVLEDSVIETLSQAGVLGDPYIFLGLMASECAEAMEAQRCGNWDQPDGVWEELADVCIRIFDFVSRFGGRHGLGGRPGERFLQTIQAKMAVNEARPFLHGKSF